MNDINIIFAFVYGIGVFFAIIPAILFVKHEIGNNSWSYGSAIWMFMLILLTSWCAIFVLISVFLKKKKHKFKTKSICNMNRF